MQRIDSAGGVAVSFEKYGVGPPLLLVHGSFSDHRTNWEFVKPHFEQRFTVYAMARRGRGETPATSGHSLVDEILDAVAIIESIGEPTFLLGHSYGAQVALGAAARVPRGVRKLVLYEPPGPNLIGEELWARLEDLAAARRWDDFATTFFRDALSVPVAELDEVRASNLWPPIIADAEASYGDLRALRGYDCNPERFRDLRVPVLLQIGTESRRELYVTDALAAILPDVRIGELQGQAHEGMTTAPELYARACFEFLREDP